MKLPADSIAIALVAGLACCWPTVLFDWHGAK